MIKVDNVSKVYPQGTAALNNINFNLDVGEMVFLTGASGAGKTSLLKLLMLAERPTKGAIYVSNVNVASLSGASIAAYRRQVGFVFQDHQLLMSKTVFDNVALPLRISGFPIENIAKRVRAALNSVGLLDKISSNVAQLSGGELQRAGIARAVVHRPKLLFADEPTGNLDPELSKDIMELLVRFQNSGTSIILATHDSSLINRYSQRVILLKNGYLIKDSRS